MLCVTHFADVFGNMSCRRFYQTLKLLLVIKKQFIFFLYIKDICFNISGDQESTEVNARNERSHLVVWQVPLNQDNIDD